ncbi:MAG: photosystem II biogenesis protein Psp29 [Cyanobacteria bacterium P01_A01_bin.105]
MALPVNTVNTVRTLSDTKRAFYAQYQRPINAIYRRVVEELMVEMHLLSVNQHFKYNALYALGVVTTYQRFMTGYLPASDIPTIFAAIVQAVGSQPEQFEQDATALQQSASGLSLEALKERFASAKSGGDDIFATTLHAIATNDRYKYSRLVAVGLYTLVEAIDAKVLDDKEQRIELMTALSDSLGLSGDKVEKDLELYRGNLDKLAQAQEVMKDIVAADRKKREERAAKQAEAAAEAAAEDTPPEDKAEVSESSSEPS